jgi:hypothetical protein
MHTQEMSLGSNVAVNDASMFTYAGLCGSMLVLGNTYQVQAIFQTNVFTQRNHIWQDGTGSAAADQSITAGNNVLLNDATITYIGSTGSQGVTDGMVELARILAGEATPNSSQIAAAFPELLGAVHVLYVQGDYYDINYLSQCNVICDANAAAQLLTSDSGQQSISTGNNQAINAATIVDGGSLTTPYVQGQAYSDTILIQTNIISTDHKITTNDPAQLVSEVVAFTGNDNTDPHQQTDAPQLFAPADSQHQNDILAGTLH